MLRASRDSTLEFSVIHLRIDLVSFLSFFLGIWDYFAPPRLSFWTLECVQNGSRHAPSRFHCVYIRGLFFLGFFSSSISTCILFVFGLNMPLLGWYYRLGFSCHLRCFMPTGSPVLWFIVPICVNTARELLAFFIWDACIHRPHYSRNSCVIWSWIWLFRKPWIMKVAFLENQITLRNMRAALRHYWCY